MYIHIVAVHVHGNSNLLTCILLPCILKLDYDVKDGERLPLAIKDMGPCEMFPQTLCHNPNGRYG